MGDVCEPSVPEVRTLLASAYQDDPLLRWVFPDPAGRLELAAAWLGLFVERTAVTGVVDTLGTDRLEAVAVWRRHTAPDSGPPVGLLPTPAGLLAAAVGAERAAAVGEALAAVRELTPAEPHAYLHFLAVDPAHRRRGLGRRVASPGLMRAEQAGVGVHLETTNPDAVPFYERLGFAVTAEVRLGADGPPLWALWRPPG